MNSKTPKICRSLSILLLLTVRCAGAAASDSSVGDRQDVAALEAAARTTAASALPPLGAHQRFKVGPVRTDLDLPRCATPLAPAVSGGTHMKDRVVVEIRCAAPTSWHVFVPVRVVGFSTAVVAAHSIVMGTVLGPADVRVEEHEMAELPAGFIDAPSVVVGLSAARPIAAGAVITNQELNAPKAIVRGQSVTLVADVGGMSVRMAGRALGDGYVNQRVRVQNLSSGKVVEGIARGQDTVEISF